MGILIDTLKSTVQSAIDDRKSYNGLTKGRPTRSQRSSISSPETSSSWSYRDESRSTYSNGPQTSMYRHQPDQDTWTNPHLYSSQISGVSSDCRQTDPEIQPRPTFSYSESPPAYTPYRDSTSTDRRESQMSLARDRKHRQQGARDDFKSSIDDSPASQSITRSFTTSQMRSNPIQGSSSGFSNRNVFQPIILPQVDYGKGVPFLRAYSRNLETFDITKRQFIDIVDAINIANIPNPEAQIFQKGASIAGWFVPGAGALGLIAGQVGVGVASAYGHQNAISKALAKANLEVFLPRGLEIWIGTTKSIDQDLGLSLQNPYSQQLKTSSPMERIHAYGTSVAPITDVLQESQNRGRSDPLALIGHQLGSSGNRKKVEKAQEEYGKGKSKDMDALNNGIKWLIVSRASSAALEAWQSSISSQNPTQINIKGDRVGRLH